MSKSRRKWWIGGVLLLILVLLLVFQGTRPSPIRIPLKDGSTLTINAITAGTRHRRPDAMSWKAFQAQFAAREWEWPASVEQTEEPCVMLWIDDPGGGYDRSLTIVDRHGWRWTGFTASRFQEDYRACFQPIETDGEVRIEVEGENGIVGTAVIPWATATSMASPDPLPIVPPVLVLPGEPASLPICRTDGPLEATLSSFDIDDNREHAIVEGCFELKTLWNGRPVVPEIGFLTITDRFGRRSTVVPERGRPFYMHLPPQDAIWDLHFRVFRSLETRLDPDEIVLVTPKPAEGDDRIQQEGRNRGRAWRLTVAPSGRMSFDWLFGPGLVRLTEDVPVIVVEVDPRHSLRIRLETRDRDGANLPVTRIGHLLSPNVFAFRAQDFDVAKGHTIRIGFDESRLMQFTVRPDEVSRRPTEPPSRK